MEERITSTRKGSITSIQAMYVPADDYTDPAPANTFAHLDASTKLERATSEQGLYPAMDPLASSSPHARARRVVGQEHYRVAAAGVLRVLQRYEELQDIIAILGMEELRRRRAGRRPRARSSASSPSRSSWPRSSPARPESMCPRRHVAASRRCSMASTTTSRAGLLHEGRDRRGARGGQGLRQEEGPAEGRGARTTRSRSRKSPRTTPTRSRTRATSNGQTEQRRRVRGQGRGEVALGRRAQDPRRGPDPGGAGLRRRGRDGLDPHEDRLARHPGQPRAADGDARPDGARPVRQARRTASTRTARTRPGSRRPRATCRSPTTASCCWSRRRSRRTRWIAARSSRSSRRRGVAPTRPRRTPRRRRASSAT